MKAILLSWLITSLFIFSTTSVYALPELSLGPFGPGAQDGSEPFNLDGNCISGNDTANPGDDCGEKNSQVRSQDNVIFNWSVAASNYTPGQEIPENVILEQILKPNTNAVVSFKRIPTRCTPTGGGELIHLRALPLTLMVT